MNLCLDIGNTRIKVAIFKGKEMLYSKAKEKWLVGDFRKLFLKYPVSKTIISTVRNTNPRFFNYLNKKTSLLVLTHKTPIPITNNYKTPKTLGKDRLAAVIGAFKNYKGNNLVIDSGTCTKYDFIDKHGVYWGGNIAPGLEMRLEAMHHFTDKLPSIKLKEPKNLLGQNTNEAINNGAAFGVILEIEAFVRRIKEEKGRINVILTGGSSSFLGKFVKSKIFVDSFLVLKGLNEILDYQTTT